MIEGLYLENALTPAKNERLFLMYLVNKFK